MKNNTKILLGVLLIGIFVSVILVSAISVNKNDVKVNTSINEKDNILKNNSVFNKGLIFKIGDDKTYASYGFKGNISANEVVRYKLNTTRWEEVTIGFYSDNGIDVSIIEEKGVKGIGSIVEKNFENIKKKDYLVKTGHRNINILIKGKNKEKYGIVVTGVKKKENVKSENIPKIEVLKIKNE